MKKTIVLGIGCLLAFILTSCSIFKNSADNSLQPEMVFLSGGTFTMGDIYGDGNSDAQPAHSVTLPNFEIGKYEVTYRQYDAFAQKTGRPLPKADSLGRGNRAVVNLNWEEAQAFCNFHGWRLPTEQEWEYAARSGGQKSRFSGTNTIDSLNNFARTDKNSIHLSFKGGTKAPNKAGLYDMSGNVYEWIGEYYQFYPKKNTKPQWENLQERGIRIIRGGSFKEPPEIAATYWRVGILKESQAYDVGFRCVNPLKNKKSR